MNTKSRRAKLLALVLPFLLLLGACKTGTTLKVSDSGQLTFVALVDVSDEGIDNSEFCSQ